ncbi:MAG: TonB-dependent receptor [Nitrospiraceae bacterium]|nr:TonB-dependent receptor [Nitrospiraceae bacterium]
MDEVVVTATRYGEKISDIPSYVTVITQEDIQASTAQNIPDLLKTEPGIHVQDVTGNGRSFSVDLRGFGESAPSNTLVLVDGRRINQADLSGVDWEDIPLDRVKKIEIIRGGRGSVLYGDNATGGVINIITKEGEGFKGTVDLMAGSFGTVKTGASVSGTEGNTSFHLSGNYLTSDGYRNNSQTDSKDVGLTTAYYLKDSVRIGLSGGYHKDKTSLPGALKESDFAAGAARTDTKFPNDFADTEDYYIKLTPEVYFGSDSSFKMDASYRKRNFVSFSSGDWGNFLGNSSIETIALSPQVVLKHKAGAATNILTAGIDYQKADNDIVNDSLFFGSRSEGLFTLKKENQGYYLHDEVALSDAVRISGGYRYDRAKFSFDPSTPDSVTFSKNVYTAGINYTFFGKSYLYMNYSRSFRYPLMDELYSFISNTVSKSLLPQTSNGYEAGMRYYFTDAIYTHVNVFRLDTDSEIIYNPFTYENENLDGRTRRDGIEISCDAQTAKWLTLRGSYTYTKAEIRDGSFSGKDVPDVPRHKATVEAISPLGSGFTASLNGVYIGSRPFISDFTNDFSNQKGYFVMNAKLVYQKKAVKAFLGVNNLTGKEYSEYGVIGGYPAEKAYYPSPKRTFVVGATVTF